MTHTLLNSLSHAHTDHAIGWFLIPTGQTSEKRIRRLSVREASELMPYTDLYGPFRTRERARLAEAYLQRFIEDCL